MSENKNYGGTAAATAKKAYEGKVALEAVERASGKTSQLHGIVHEVMFKDLQNATPSNIAQGTKASLTKSVTAVRDDIVLTNNGNVVGRYQLKDTANNIYKTTQQAASGKYSGTNLVGTKETAEAYSKVASNAAQKGTRLQQMKSSGVSSKDTTRIATEVVGGKINPAALSKVATNAGVAGAVIGGGIALVCEGSRWVDGDISDVEFAANVAQETVGSGLSAAGGGVLGSLASGAVATALATTAAPVCIPVVVGIGTTIVAGSIIKNGFDSVCDGFKDLFGIY